MEPPQVPLNSKSICQLYFGKQPIKDNIWKCSCGIQRKCNISKSGYNNLLTHVKQQHPDYEEMFRSTQCGIGTREGSESGSVSVVRQISGQTSLDFLIDSKSKTVFKWIEWIVMDEHPLTFCEKELTRSNTNLPKISTKTLKKYLLKLVVVVEKQITSLVDTAPAYALIFDGWSEDSTHFIGLFVAFHVADCVSASSPHLYLLAFAPLSDGTSFTAEKHAEFIRSNLQWYNLSISKLACLIGDNCSTNKRTAEILGIPLLGCRSHRFNLAMEAYMNSTLSQEVTKVAKLMSKLSTLKEAGRLRLTTTLRPVKRNATRWTGAISMLQRYDRICDSINQTDRETAALIPSAHERIRIQDQLEPLLQLKSITESLQKANLTFAESEALLESVIAEFPEFPFEDFISMDAKIVAHPFFESAVVKIQNHKESELSLREEEAVSALLKAAGDCEEDDLGDLSFAQKALKKRRVSVNRNSSRFINTLFLSPTSNEVERLFSMTARVFSVKRRQLLPRTLESLVFLKRNRALWNLPLVSQIVNDKTDREGDIDQEEIDSDEYDSDGF
jgi:hypothetical protein